MLFNQVYNEYKIRNGHDLFYMIEKFHIVLIFKTLLSITLRIYYEEKEVTVYNLKQSFNYNLLVVQNVVF